MFSSDRYRFKVYASGLNLKNFDCGSDELNIYLKQYAGQDQKRGISKTYILIDNEQEVVGYFSISMAQIAFESLPEKSKKKLPRYPVPAVSIGRLAVDSRFHGSGFGEFILVYALKLSLGLQETIGVYAVIVDAKNAGAERFYKHFGFIELTRKNRVLFLPLKTIQKSFHS